MTLKTGDRVKLTPDVAAKFPDLTWSTGTVELLGPGVVSILWDGAAVVSWLTVNMVEPVA